jgi:PPP family 3-phenylpropionic acid transporter
MPLSFSWGTHINSLKGDNGVLNTSKNIGRKVNAGYCAIQSAFVSSISVWFGFITVILQSKGFNNAQVGITMALGASFSIILPPLIAMFYDRHRKIPLKVIVVAIVLVAMLCAAAAIFIQVPVALVMLIFALVNTATLTTMPLINAIAMQFENIGVPVNYGIARGLGSVGYAVFGYITGLLVEKLGVDVLSPFYILLLIVTAVFVLILKKPQRSGTEQVTEKTLMPTLKTSSEWKGFYKNPACVFFFFAMACMTLNHGTLDTFQVSIIKSVGGTNSDYGMLMFVMASSEIPTMFMFKYLTKRFSYAQLMSVACLAFAAKDVILLIAPSVGVVIAAQGINMLTLGLYLPASVYYANMVAPKGAEVQAQALFGGMAMGLGRIIGNLIGGVIIDFAGLDAMLVFSGVFVLIGFVLMQASNMKYKEPAKTKRRGSAIA